MQGIPFPKSKDKKGKKTKVDVSYQHRVVDFEDLMVVGSKPNQ